MTDPSFQAPDPGFLSQLLPAYEVRDFIAQGGMGVVYLAHQRTLDRPTAIKILPPELGADEVFRRSFETEARAMARLNHPNLIAVYDFGEVDGLLYIAMEYVPGKSLHHSAHGLAVAPDQSAEMIASICRGLAHAHENGIVHRDVKPANVLLTPRREPKLGDFGLAVPHDAEHAGLVMGTPDYLAPEVLQGLTQGDARSDIFAVGVMLHELLTGKLPAPEDPPPSAVSGCDPALDAICEKATRPDPADRFESISEMADALDAWLHAPTPEISAEPTRSVAPRRRNLSPAPLIRNLVIIAILLIAIAFTWKAYQTKQHELTSPPPPPKPAATAGISPPAASRPPPPSTPEAPVAPTPEKAPAAPAETPAQSLRRLRESLTAGDFDELPTGTLTSDTSHYFPVTSAMTWDQARRFAADYGGHLPLIDDPAEIGWIAERSDSPQWLGSSRRPDGTWQAINGSAWPAATEIQGDGTAASLTTDGRLAAVAADQPLPFLIEWARDGSDPTDLRHILARTAASIEGGQSWFPAGTEAHGDNHRLVVLDPMTHADARALAVAGNARLMAPTTPEAADWLASATAELPPGSRLWLGGERDGLEWKWPGDQPWTFARWADGHPSGDFGALTIEAGNGWADSDPSEPVAGCVLEWGPVPTPDPPPDSGLLPPSEIREKTEELLVALDAKRQTALEKNEQVLRWDIGVWLRGLTKGDAERWQVDVDRILQRIHDHRIPTGIPRKGSDHFHEGITRIGTAALDQQAKIDRAFEKQASVIHDAFLQRLDAYADAMRKTGQMEIAHQLREELDEMKDLTVWLGTFERIASAENPRLSPIRILRAIYGTGGKDADVTQRVRTIVEGEGRDFWVNPRELGADPNPGWNKGLRIHFEINGRDKWIEKGENSKVPLSDFR